MNYGVDLHNSFLKIAYFDSNGKLNFKQFTTDQEGIRKPKMALKTQDRIAVESGIKSFCFHDQLKEIGCKFSNEE